MSGRGQIRDGSVDAGVGGARPFEPSRARDSWDPAIAALAAAQHGVVSRAQLRAIGLTAAAVRHRVRRRRLIEVHPGVFAVGHRLLTPRGWWMAAVLACGAGALLSHRAAAALWGLIDHGPSTIDVLVLRSVRARPGVRPRRVRAVDAADRAHVDRIACTSVARTLIDLATVVDERTLDRALRRAQDLRLFDRYAVDEVVGRSRAGSRRLRQAVLVLVGDDVTRRRLKSELELRFVKMLQRHGFVLPSTNVGIETPWGTWEVDAVWPAERIVIELDGWWAHRDRESFRRDHRRATDVRGAGYDVSRLSWDQVALQELETVERLARFLPRVSTDGTA